MQSKHKSLILNASLVAVIAFFAMFVTSCSEDSNNEFEPLLEFTEVSIPDYYKSDLSNGRTLSSSDVTVVEMEVKATNSDGKEVLA